MGSPGVAGMAREVDALVLALARLSGAAAGLAFVSGTAIERVLEEGWVGELTQLVDANTAGLAGLADRLAAGVLAFDDGDESGEADGG